MPRVKSGPVNEPVRRRDFIPDGEPLTEVEEKSFKFGADPFEVEPQWVPDDDAATTAAIGDPDEQLQEAAELVKKRNELEAKAEASGKKQIERMNKLAALNVGETIALIESASTHERQLWLAAENATRGRKMVLRHFGIS